MTSMHPDYHPSNVPRHEPEPIAPPLPNEVAPAAKRGRSLRGLPLFVWVTVGLAVVLLPALLSTLLNGGVKKKKHPAAEQQQAKAESPASLPVADMPVMVPEQQPVPELTPEPVPQPEQPLPVDNDAVVPNTVPAEQSLVTEPKVAQQETTSTVVTTINAGTPRSTPAHIRGHMERSREEFWKKEVEFTNTVIAFYNQQIALADSKGKIEEAKRWRKAVTVYSQSNNTPHETFGEEVLEKMITARAQREQDYIWAIRQAEALPDESLGKFYRTELNNFMHDESKHLGDILLLFPDAQFRIVSPNTGLALGVREGSLAVMQVKPDRNDPFQQWCVLSPGTNQARLLNCQTNRVLCLDEPRRLGGTQLIQVPIIQNGPFYWDFQHQGDHYLIQSKHNEQYVTGKGVLPQAPLGVQQVSRELQDGLPQKWVFVRTLPELAPPRKE